MPASADRKISVPSASIRPARHGLVNRLAIVPLRGIARWNIETLAVQTIANTNRNRIHSIETVEVGDRELVNPIDHRRVMRRHCIEPTTAARPPGGRAEFAPHFVQSFGKARVFGRERSFAHPRRVSLHHPNHAIHSMRRNARAGAGATGRRIR